MTTVCCRCQHRYEKFSALQCFSLTYPLKSSNPPSLCSVVSYSPKLVMMVLYGRLAQACAVPATIYCIMLQYDIKHMQSYVLPFCCIYRTMNRPIPLSIQNVLGISRNTILLYCTFGQNFRCVYSINLLPRWNQQGYFFL